MIRRTILSPMGNGCRARRAPAFTLLEILLVLSLLVLLAGLAWPALAERLAGASLPETADRFRSLLTLTRSSAMMEHRRHRIRFEKDVQQPFIEYEPDPIGRPGEYVAVDQDWANDPPLLENVYVHDVIPGRPAYLEPVSTASKLDEETQTFGAESTTDLNSGATSADDAFKISNAIKEEHPDEMRPSIIFEPDGSTDWATFIVAQTPSSEPLPDSARQYWVVLDGRTGLAKMREGITEAELASDEFVISREKLILPKKTDVNDLTLTVTNPDGSDSTGNPLSGLTGLPGGDLNSLLKAAQTGAGKAPTTPKNAIPKFPGDPSVKPLQPIPPPGPGEAAPADGTQQGGTMDQLDQKLSDSDLTEQEQERIRQSLKGNKGR